MKLIKKLILLLKTKPFHKLEKHATFNIIDDMGKAGFIKTGCIYAMCLDSENGTYEIGKEYAMEMHERVYMTCQRNRDYLLALMFYAICGVLIVLFYLYIFN